MKKLLIVFAFTVIAAGANAQTNKAKSKTQAQPATKTAVDRQEAAQDYYARVDGNIVLMKSGTKQGMENDAVQFENGNSLTRDGVFIYNNGTEKMMLEEGMRIDTKGNIVGRGKEQTPAPDQPMQAVPDQMEK